MRPIDADALKETISKYKFTAPNKMYQHGGECALNFYMPKIIDDTPTIEIEPVRHGHWFEGGGPLMPMHKYDEYTNPESVFFATCSECRVTINCNGVLGGYSYCPVCGAKMDRGCKNRPDKSG